MQVFRALAGYSLGRADVVRRAMSKKKHDVMEREREIFLHGLTEDGRVIIDGCERRGIPEKVADVIFNDMSTFASYAFNKPHAAAYAVVVYQTAYLKCFYPKEYMAALLTSVFGSGKVAGYIGECNRMGIEVLPPSVNESNAGFTVAGDHIRFGLLAVKNLGNAFIQELVREREENGPYTSFYAFCKRLSPCREFNRRGLDSLIRCGALDGLGANRRQMLSVADLVLDQLDEVNRRNLDGQLGFFDSPELGGQEEIPLPDLEELSYADRLAMEKEVTGLYLSGHPLEPYAAMYKPLHAARIDRILEAIEEQAGGYTDGTQVQLLGMVDHVRTQVTRRNTTMAYVQFEDLYGSMELLVFPQTYERYAPLLGPGAALLVAGRISVREEEEPRLIVDRIAAAPSPGEQPPAQDNAAPVASAAGRKGAAPGAAPARQTAPSPRHGLYLRLPGEADPLYKRAVNLLSIFEGEEPVYIRFADTGKLVRAPRSLWIWPNEPLLGELRRVLGEENVAVVN